MSPFLALIAIKISAIVSVLLLPNLDIRKMLIRFKQRYSNSRNLVFLPFVMMPVFD